MPSRSRVRRGVHLPRRAHPTVELRYGRTATPCSCSPCGRLTLPILPRRTIRENKIKNMSSRKVPRDPGAPKRNMSAYLLYQNAMRDTFKQQVRSVWSSSKRGRQDFFLFSSSHSEFLPPHPLPLPPTTHTPINLFNLEPRDDIRVS